MTRLTASIAAVAVLALAPAAASAATPFGANLEAAESTSSFSCAGPVPPFGFTSGHATCTAFTAGRFGDGAGSHLVPNGVGVITRIDVRMPGVPSGPMQVTILRALRQAQSTTAVCCHWAGESEVFTPPAGVISSHLVRLPVKSELTQSNVYEFDAVALSALTAQTPMPAAPLPNQSSGAYFPHVSQGQERFEQQASLGENQIMLRAFWEPDADADGFGDETQDRCPGAVGRRARSAQCGATPPPPGTPPPSDSPGSPGSPEAPDSPPGGSGSVAPRIAAGSARVRSGRAEIRLFCGDAGACKGLLRLQDRKTAGRTAAQRRRARTFATSSFTIRAGASKTVRARLNAAGRRLLARRRRATVWANVAPSRGAAASSRLVIRR